jgi:hypothetical protein
MNRSFAAPLGIYMRNVPGSRNPDATHAADSGHAGLEVASRYASIFSEESLFD